MYPSLLALHQSLLLLDEVSKGARQWALIDPSMHARRLCQGRISPPCVNSMAPSSSTPVISYPQRREGHNSSTCILWSPSFYFMTAGQYYMQLRGELTLWMGNLHYLPEQFTLFHIYCFIHFRDKTIQMCDLIQKDSVDIIIPSLLSVPEYHYCEGSSGKWIMVV